MFGKSISVLKYGLKQDWKGYVAMEEHTRINPKELSVFYLFNFAECLYKSKAQSQSVSHPVIDKGWQEHITGFII